MKRILLGITLLLSGCGQLLAPSAATTTTSTLTQPTLSDGDFASVPPCSNRDLLANNATFLDDLTGAIEVIHTHKKADDDNGLPALCGLAKADNALEESEVGWDPLNGVDINVCNSFSEELSTFPESSSYFPGKCRSNFTLSTDPPEDGFPRGGIYRVDLCIAGAEQSYDLRLRITVSGKDANKTWASLKIEDADSIEVFDEKGFQISSVESLKAAMVQNPAGTSFTIRSNKGTKTHLKVDVQIICIKTRDACALPAGSCATS